MRKYGKVRLLVGATLVAALLAGCAVAQGDGPTASRGGSGDVSTAPGAAPSGEPVARAASVLGPSVVQVNVTGTQQTPYGEQEGEGLGSGVIYRQDGYIVTNNHVVEGASSVEVAFADGSTETGEVVGTDAYTDLAVIRVDRDDLPAATFREQTAVPGQLAVAIGSPQGFQSTVTSGVVSGTGRELPAELTGGDTSLVDLVQTDAAISPGNSGGALADRTGGVLGVNVAYIPPETGAESLGFAIPSETVVSIADQLIESGEAVHPFLGVSLTDLSAAEARGFGTAADSGALVTEVEPGGPAADAGLRPESVITAIGDAPVKDSGDLLSGLRDYMPGDTVALTVTSNRGDREVRVELGELDA